MSWLLREGDVLAAVDPPAGGWPATIRGASVRRAPVLVHTLSANRRRDVAWCQDGRTEGGEPCLEVRYIATLAPRRIHRPALKGAVLVAEDGAFERWHLQVGDRLQIQDA